MSATQSPQLTVILPFGDDEDQIGTAVREVARTLNEANTSFEILAVDENSGDNSHAVLALLRGSVPQLRVVHASHRGKGFACGLAKARGSYVWLLPTPVALSSLAAFGRAFAQVTSGSVDAVLVRDRFCIASRSRILGIAANLRGTGAVYLRKLSKRAAIKELVVDERLINGAAPRAGGLALDRSFARLRNVLMSARRTQSPL